MTKIERLKSVEQQTSFGWSRLLWIMVKVLGAEGVHEMLGLWLGVKNVKLVCWMWVEQRVGLRVVVNNIQVVRGFPGGQRTLLLVCDLELLTCWLQVAVLLAVVLLPMNENEGQNQNDKTVMSIGHRNWVGPHLGRKF